MTNLIAEVKREKRARKWRPYREAIAEICGLLALGVFFYAFLVILQVFN